MGNDIASSRGRSGYGEGGRGGGYKHQLRSSTWMFEVGSRTEGDKFKSVCCSQNRRGKKDMDQGFRVESLGCNM